MKTLTKIIASSALAGCVFSGAFVYIDYRSNKNSNEKITQDTSSDFSEDFIDMDEFIDTSPAKRKVSDNPSYSNDPNYKYAYEGTMLGSLDIKSYKRKLGDACLEIHIKPSDQTLVFKDVNNDDRPDSVVVIDKMSVIEANSSSSLFNNNYKFYDAAIKHICREKGLR